MKKALVIFLIIILSAGLISGFIIKKNKQKSYSTILDNNEMVAYFVVRFRDNSVKIEEDNKVKAICEMLDEKVKRDKTFDNSKGWRYEITAMDSNDNKLKTIIVIDDGTITMNGKAYSCKKINVSKLDELTGIDRFK